MDICRNNFMLDISPEKLIEIKVAILGDYSLIISSFPLDQFESLEIQNLHCNTCNVVKCTTSKVF